jgi:hypothetical protein
MKKIFLVVLILMVITACQPSEEAIQQAIAETQAANPTEMVGETEVIEIIKTSTETPKPINTELPTFTPSPDFTNTPSRSPEELSQIFLDGVEGILMTLGSDDVNSINLIRMQENILEIELVTNWASKDKQPNTSYNVVKLFTTFAEAWEKPDNQLFSLFPEGFDINLTTYSIMGDYKYSSFTDFETLKKISKKSISYEEWVDLSSAEFK